VWTEENNGKNNEKFLGLDFREFRAVYSIQFFSLCLLVDKFFVLKSVCLQFFWCH
jgi:hypothetical protein